MKTVGILADIHANLPALERVITDAGDVDAWLCAGDVVGYGPYPNECMDLVRELGASVVAGNHDLGSVDAISLSRFNRNAYIANEWTSKVLDPQNKAAIEAFPTTGSFDGLDALLVHGSPLDPIWQYVHSEEQAAREFNGFFNALCFHGHSHVPAVFALQQDGRSIVLDEPEGDRRVPIEPGKRYMVNVGSVGQPRDGDPRACYAMFYPEQGLVIYRRVEYDIARTQRKMEQIGLPVFLISRLAGGR